MIVGFTGTQAGMTDAQVKTVEKFLKVWHRYLTIHAFWHGDCIGADGQAVALAASLGIPTMAWPGPDPKRWSGWVSDASQPPMPFLKRNKLMVMGSHRLIAAPRGPEIRRSGTWSTVRYARNDGRVPVWIVMPDGSWKTG